MSDLGEAVDRAPLGGWPVEVWVAVANGLAEGGRRYGVDEAKAFARAHPEVVYSVMRDGWVRYLPAASPNPTTVGESMALSERRRARAAEIKRELLALVGQRFADPGVAEYLLKSLPGGRADEDGRLDLMREAAGDLVGARLFAETLLHHGDSLPLDERPEVWLESAEWFAGIGDKGTAASVRARVAEVLEKLGNREGAIEQLKILLVEYHRLVRTDDRYVPYYGAALLNLGRLYGELRNWPEAKTVTRQAIEQLRRAIFVQGRDNPHAQAQLIRADEQLRRLRWRRGGAKRN
ncbi:hypothetical protein ACIA49_09540 [Kribbella sp. NPDC051587]|uniref:hypothetical protein n=1 Tax=Kribbella sp. NPDC051587 TaxID=3364119 RepID=UPI00379DB92E